MIFVYFKIDQWTKNILGKYQDKTEKKIDVDKSETPEVVSLWGLEFLDCPVGKAVDLIYAKGWKLSI
ncbi:hypothetical protein ATY37_15455 [Vibrio cidicii]|uniref:Uncharacterized protein n=1 Tax=Vibrio cidicii TaxID=1763883 RepID=A0A151KWY1_9VIBR|nr:hypothetical protein ATY37_15455 [Vibrio cidicii]